MHIGIIGAGAIGCYVGGKLAREPDVHVTFVGRARGLADAKAKGFVLEALDGSKITIAPADLDYQIDATALANCEVVLCAVKSAQTKDAGASLAQVIAPHAIVVSLQNGVHNADHLRAELPKNTVLGGIVGFNVVARDDGAFRLGTTGPIVIEADADPRVSKLAALLVHAGFEVEVTADIRAKQWSKLVINLNNALGALSGAPTQRLVFDAGYRRVVRAVTTEALAVLRAAGIRAARLGPLPVAVFPYLLALPTPLFKLAARAQLRIDPEARSSMWQDLSRNRRTEVDELNGEIVRQAVIAKVGAPLNAALVRLVHEAETKNAGSPNLSAKALWNAIGGSI